MATTFTRGNTKKKRPPKTPGVGRQVGGVGTAPSQGFRGAVTSARTGEFIRPLQPSKTRGRRRGDPGDFTPPPTGLPAIGPGKGVVPPEKGKKIGESGSTLAQIEAAKLGGPITETGAPPGARVGRVATEQELAEIEAKKKELETGTLREGRPATEQELAEIQAAIDAAPGAGPETIGGVEGGIPTTIAEFERQFAQELPPEDIAIIAKVAGVVAATTAGYYAGLGIGASALPFIERSTRAQRDVAIQRMVTKLGVDTSVAIKAVDKALLTQTAAQIVKGLPIATIAAGVGIGGLLILKDLAETDTMITWFALDNVIGTASLFLRDLIQDVKFGNMDAADALIAANDTMRTRQIAVDKAEKSTAINPALMPQKNVILAGLEQDQAILDFRLAQLEAFAAGTLGQQVPEFNLTQEEILAGQTEQELPPEVPS